MGALSAAEVFSIAPPCLLLGSSCSGSHSANLIISQLTFNTRRGGGGGGGGEGQSARGSSGCDLGAFFDASGLSRFFLGCMEVMGGDGNGDGRRVGDMKGETKVSGGE